MKGGPNIINLREILRDSASKTTTLVLDCINNVDYKTLYPKFTDQEVRHYMYEVFRVFLNFVYFIRPLILLIQME